MQSSFVKIAEILGRLAIGLFVKIPAPPFGAVSKRVIDLVEEVGSMFVDVLLIITQGRNVTVGDVPIVRANIVRVYGNRSISYANTSIWLSNSSVGSRSSVDDLQ